MNFPYMLTKFVSVCVLPRLIYSYEPWSNITDKGYQALQSAQLLYLQNMAEVPIAAFYLDLESCALDSRGPRTEVPENGKTGPLVPR